MNIECPECGSAEFTRVSLIYAQGLSDLDARSRGWGILIGSGGADLGFGSFRTKGQIQSRLSQKVSPPCKLSYWKIALGGLIGLMILEFILGYVDTFLHTGGNFNQQLAWCGYAWLGLVAIMICLAVRHNFGVFPRRHRVWDRSFMCRRCGHVLQLHQTLDSARQALRRPVEPQERC